MPKVTLITHTQNPETVIAAAAKLCYSPATVDDLLSGLDAEKSAKFLEMLTAIGHESPIEHCSFTFALEGVSRSLMAQITRHRIASFSVQSQRYVAENDFDYIIPPEIEGIPEARALFLESMDKAGEYYNRITTLLEEKHLARLIDAGEPEKTARSKARKQAIEDARFVLPNACDTKMMLTMNARSLLHFFQLRCCARAQWEIRSVAREMLRLVYPVAPTLFQAAGPACVRGGCSEGKMPCGRPQEVREEIAALRQGENQ